MSLVWLDLGLTLVSWTIGKHSNYYATKYIAFSLLFWCFHIFHGRPVYLSFLNLSIFFIFVLHFRHRWLGITKIFCQTHYGSPSWLSFTIIFIVSVDISYVEATFLFNYLCLTAFWMVQEMSFNFILICMCKLEPVIVLGFKFQDLFLIFHHY